MAYRTEPDTPADYDDLNLDEYRRRFPKETEMLSNKDIYDIVMDTDDDLSDEEWIDKFQLYVKPDADA